MSKRIKKSLSLILSIVMVIGLFAGIGFAPAYAKDECGYTPNGTVSQLVGVGTDAEAGQCYKITNTDDLIALSDYINDGKNSIGVTFYLGNDIDLTDVTWYPIGGKDSTAFEGIFDGCGFAVLHLVSESEKANDVGLFGFVKGADAVIKNVGVLGSISGKDDIAGIAANLDGASIMNSWNAVNLTGDTNVGGIAANVSDGRIENCCNFGYVSGSSNVGAIAGKLTGSSVIDYSYYNYFSADKAYGSLSANSTSNVFRFAGSSTEVLTEKELTVDNRTTDDLVVLLNEWVDMQKNSLNYFEWVYDSSDSGHNRVGGRYPSHRYPGYIDVKKSLYTATSTMTKLYEAQENAVDGGYYSISTPTELYYFAEYCNAGYNTFGVTFFLTDDLIIGTGVGSVEQIHWTPIGSDEKFAFRGVLDGQGYIISATLISGVDNLGLFGFIDDQTSVVKNLGVTNFEISGNDQIGGIVGNLTNGSIINCWFDGKITGDDRVGGIAGRVDNGTIYNCVGFAQIVANGTCGGIAGDTGTSTVIKYCYYNSGNTSGVGDADSTTTALLSYTESGTDFELERSISVGGNSTVKLLNALNHWVNLLAPDDTYRNWKIDTSAESVLRVGGKHPTHLFPNDTTGLHRVDEPYNEDNNKGNPYNVHYNPTSTMTELYNAHTNGISGGKYSISSGVELDYLSKYVNAGGSTTDMVFYLTDDIIITPQCAAYGADGWMPIGRDANVTDPSTYVRSFRGTFDGCGYTVYGLTITKNEADDAGLFGHVDRAVIKNLGVVGDIVAENKIGGLAADVEDSTIINCWTAVNIQGEDRIGGIVGRAGDTDIINCVSYGEMLAYGGSASAVAGGIVGVATGTCKLQHDYYMQTTFNQAYQSIGGNCTCDAISFTYSYKNDEYICTLEKAAVIDDVSTTNLLTALNTWVYMQNNGQYCAWYCSPTLLSVGELSGHFPKLMSPELTDSTDNKDYVGDYTATCSVSDLYSTRSDGIEGCAYSINGLSDLEAFQKYVNDGYKTYGIIFFMTRNIDMSSAYSLDTSRSWTPIGNVKNPFVGIFDGQGYTIKYLYINTTDDDQGLFGHLSTTSAVIKNLGLSGTVTGGNNSAGIVGDFNFGTIANCWVSCEVTSLTGNAGGIVGGANMGKIINCTSYGAVIGGVYGAIAGYAAGTEMSYCYYLYATCQLAYSLGSAVLENGVQYFNGTSAVCVMHEKITVEGTETKNVLSALKLYVDAHPETNYCYWASGSNEEYFVLGVMGYPVLLTADGNLDGEILSETQAYYNGKEYTSVVTAINDANDNINGGDVTLATNVVLAVKENLTLDDNVRLLTGDYTLNIKSQVKARSMQQLIGVFTINKDGGSIYTWDTSKNDYKLFLYAKKDSDPSCNSEIYGTQSITFLSSEVKGSFPYAYNLTLQDGEFIVNSTLDSGNPHKIPAGSTITVDTRATFNVRSNARIRTTGDNSCIMNKGTVKIGNATLDLNGGVRMVGVFEDDGGNVSLPFVYRDSYTLRGWTDGVNIYPAGKTVDVQTATTLTAQWKIGDSGDPYPGDGYYIDQDEPIYNIPITVIQTAGGRISPQSIKAAKGENLTFSFVAEDGYYIKNVLVDGKSVTLDDKDLYTFVSISSAHTVIALFAPITNSEYRSWSNPFDDVSSSDWCYDSIRYVVSAGLFSGTSSNTFSPNNTMTRDMVVVVLWRLSGCPVVPDNGAKFYDVSQGNYAYDAVRWANYYGIVMGFNDGSFGYGKAVTREQLITFLFRYAKNYAGDDVAKYDNVNILGYTDVLQISRGMTQPFQWGIGSGIVSGTSTTTLSPKANTTRAQVAAILTRYCNTFLLKIPVVTTA